MYSDPESGLRASSPSTTPPWGRPAAGPMWPYATEQEALTDALNLSRAMTYKSAARLAPWRWGKASSSAIPARQNESCFGPGAGSSIRWAVLPHHHRRGHHRARPGCVRQETEHVVGLDVTLGGSGDTSVMTGLGIYMGMRACAADVWGTDNLRGRTVAMQGFGKVATSLRRSSARTTSASSPPTSRDGPGRARQMGVKVVGPDEIYDAQCDIFAPCALGGSSTRHHSSPAMRHRGRRRQQPMTPRMARNCIAGNRLRPIS